MPIAHLTDVCKWHSMRTNTAVDLLRALKLWMYTHTAHETDELIYNLGHNYNLVPMVKAESPQQLFRRSSSWVYVRPFSRKSNDDLKTLAAANPSTTVNPTT
jgi:hypothetical protein